MQSSGEANRDEVCSYRDWWLEALSVAQGGSASAYAIGFTQVLGPGEKSAEFFRKWLLRAHPDKRENACGPPSVANLQSPLGGIPTVDDVLSLRNAHRRLCCVWPNLETLEGARSCCSTSASSKEQSRRYCRSTEIPRSDDGTPDKNSGCRNQHLPPFPVVVVTALIVGISLTMTLGDFVVGLIFSCRRSRSTFGKSSRSSYRIPRCETPPRSS